MLIARSKEVLHACDTRIMKGDVLTDLFKFFVLTDGSVTF